VDLEKGKAYPLEFEKTNKLKRKEDTLS